MKQLCSYCGAPAIKQLLNGRWCCQETAHKCPGMSKNKSDRMKAHHYNSKKQKTQREIDIGMYRCMYCGAVAVRQMYHGGFCCKEKANDCPEYSNFLSNIHKMKYKDHPEFCDKMSIRMKKVQNRSEVKKAKSESMLRLHNDDCDECKDFKINFNEAHRKRRTDDYERNLRYKMNTIKHKKEMEENV